MLIHSDDCVIFIDDSIPVCKSQLALHHNRPLSESSQHQLSDFTHRSSSLAATSRLRLRSLLASAPPRLHVFWYFHFLSSSVPSSSLTLSSAYGNVFVDLTSSPGSSPRSAVHGAPATVSTVELADPSLDLAGVRASLSALQQSIDQVEALRELRSDHEDLRREFLATRHRAEDLDRQLADAANAASPYEDRRMPGCIRYDEAVSEFRIGTLEAQLAAASSFGVVVPPDTARRIADLESQLARSQSDLQVARDRQSALASELRESATSHRAAQAEVARLEAAIMHKNGRLRTLNDNYERRLRVADTTIATHTAELNRLRDRVSTLDRDFLKASQRAQAAISQRDQAKAAHIAAQDRVSAARDTIARLERRINQVEKSQKIRQDLESALAKLQQEKDDLTVQRDELLGQLGERFMEITDLRAERDQAPEKLPNIASLLPSAPGHKRARPGSESPPQSARVSKAARSTSSSSPASVSSRVPASGSSIEVLSAVAAGQTAERSASSLSSAGLPGHLPRSVRSATKMSGRGTSSSSAAPEADVDSDGDESSSDESGSTHVFDSDTAGSDSGTSKSSGAKNEFGMPSSPLSNAELAALQPTTVPRSEWIPGYRDRRSFRGHDI
ncbi:hypothetical protein F442_23111, partial [Phytophthora nicotianae P10297]